MVEYARARPGALLPPPRRVEQPGAVSSPPVRSPPVIAPRHPLVASPRSGRVGTSPSVFEDTNVMGASAERNDQAHRQLGGRATNGERSGTANRGHRPFARHARTIRARWPIGTQARIEETKVSRGSAEHTPAGTRPSSDSGAKPSTSTMPGRRGRVCGSLGGATAGASRGVSGNRMVELPQVSPLRNAADAKALVSETSDYRPSAAGNGHAHPIWEVYNARGRRSARVGVRR